MEKVLPKTDEDFYLNKINDLEQQIYSLENKRKSKKGEMNVANNGNDNILHPAHYCFSKFEPKDVIHEWGLSFDLGNVVKYVARAGKKDGNSKLQDLRKARQYLDFEIEFLEKESVQR